MTSQAQAQPTKKVVAQFHPRKRIGKTEKDKASRAHSRAIENRQARADWQNSGGAFPYAHCNGKRNKTVFTGKGNRQVMLAFKSEPVGKRK
jgi:hypothetical protein